jgi:hypothetical protein
MNPPSEDIKDILISSAAGIDLTFGTNLFISSMPDSPDLCACIYDTGGSEPEHNYNYMRPTIQTTIRGKKSTGYRDAWKLAETIRNVLYAIHNETWNGTWYIGVWAETDIFFVGYDENKRPLLTVNFRIHRSE